MNDARHGAIDSDSHYYETRDAFTRHIDPAHLDLAIRPVTGDDGVECILVGDRPFTYLSPQYDRVPIPGSLRSMLREFSAGKIEGFFDDRVSENMRSEYQNRDARLAVMDKQKLQATMLFPALGVCVEHFMKDNVEQTYANVSAFNRWLEDDWGFAYQNRLYAAALMSLLDVDSAVREVESLIERGVRIIHLRPGPQAGRSPADPVFDPFWARVNEARLVVACHSSESGYNEMFSRYWSEAPNPTSHQQSAFQWTNFFGDRPIMDTLSAMVLHNLFGRFPDVRVMSIENGSVWVSYLLKVMDKMKGMGRTGSWLGGKVEGKPSDIFKEHVWVSPFHEENIYSLVSLLGADRVLFGSDYPHAEGLANPTDFTHGVEKLPQPDIDKIMFGNAQSLLAAS